MSRISDSVDERKRRFTSMKLDLLDCMASDRKLKPYDFRVAFVILQHVSEKTGEAYPSDETIAEIAGGSVRNVYNSRRRLREAGWFSWRRTRKSNIYRPRHDRVNAMLDMIIVAREARKERREERRARRRDTQPVADLNFRDTQPVADLDTQPVADKHLRGTPQKRGVFRVKDSESERSHTKRSHISREDSKSAPRRFSANGAGAKPKPAAAVERPKPNGRAPVAASAAPTGTKPMLALDSAMLAGADEARFKAFRELASAGMPSDPAHQQWHLLGCAAAVGFSGADLTDLHHKLARHFTAHHADHVARVCKGEAA